MIKNPISTAARGVIYVVSIVIGGAGLVATAILPIVSADAWMPVVLATVSATSLVASALARDNLAEVSDNVGA